jgi:hypothetical protein
VTNTASAGPATSLVSGSAAAIGALAASAIGSVLMAIGAAAFLSLAATDRFDPRWLLYGAIAWAGISLSVSAYCAGRLAAVNGRTHTERDGAMHGLVAWAVLDAIALAVAAGVALTRPEMVEVLPALWAFVGAQLVTLGCALLGGVHGARGEARRIGLVAVRPKRLPRVGDLADYEQTFMEPTGS